MPGILEQIVTVQRKEIERAKERRSEAELREALVKAPPVRSFRDALAAAGGIKLIAEVKKASPSKGVIRADFHPVSIAKIYQQYGAACISVLTEVPHFQGSLEYLQQIRQVVDRPLLRKDFILDRYQLLEARMHGADAVLLIAECLDDQQLQALHQETLALGMTPLVEFYEPENLPRVLAAGATLIGVNNRDLRTFQVDLNHTLRMRERIPADCLVVGESGIQGREDVLRLEQGGVDAILVGERLMAAPAIGPAVEQLLGR